MKAQSELMGDHERTAEMTVPHFGGATNWMSISGSTIGLNDSMLGNSISGCLTKDNFGIGLDGRTLRIGTSGLIEDEVSHRPAGQQWPVCTP